jgi:uncharacterized membrane protein YqiK
VYKKAQGLPLNTIIVAIIVIVVLVVIILIFTGQIGGINTAAQEGQACRKAGGYCASTDGGSINDDDVCVLGGTAVVNNPPNDCGGFMRCCMIR